MPQDYILLHKLATPKQVTLPSGRTLGLRRQRLRYFGPRKPRRRRQHPQQGTGIETNIIRGIHLGKKAAYTELGHMIVDDAVGLIPKAYRKLKNKLFKRNKPTVTMNIYPATGFSKETY